MQNKNTYILFVKVAVFSNVHMAFSDIRVHSGHPRNFPNISLSNMYLFEV